MRSPACFLFVALLVGLAIWPGPAGAEQQGAAASESALSAGEILEQRCSGCHAPEQEGGSLDVTYAQCTSSRSPVGL